MFSIPKHEWVLLSSVLVLSHPKPTSIQHTYKHTDLIIYSAKYDLNETTFTRTNKIYCWI